jgi:hypothetical protein
VSGERVERRLAAILAADVAGCSRLMGQDEGGTLARLRTHRGEPIHSSKRPRIRRLLETTNCQAHPFDIGNLLDNTPDATLRKPLFLDTSRELQPFVGESKQLVNRFWIGTDLLGLSP